MIISIDEEKAFNKTYHTFMINSLNKIDRNTYKRKCSKKKKVIYEKPTANIIINRENRKFSSKIWYKARIPLLPLLFNTVLE